mgnify:CR=1 FL=1
MAKVRSSASHLPKMLFLKEVNKALRRNDDRQKRNQNKRNGEQSVRPAHSDGELAANSIVPGGDHNEQSCDRKQDAGNRYNTVRDSCQKQNGAGCI